MFTARRVLSIPESLQFFTSQHLLAGAAALREVGECGIGWAARTHSKLTVQQLVQQVRPQQEP